MRLPFARGGAVDGTVDPVSTLPGVSKKKHRKGRPSGSGGRVTPKGGHRASRPVHDGPGTGLDFDLDLDLDPEPEEHPLADVVGGLAEDHPMQLLAVASTMASVLMPVRSPFERGATPDVDPAMVLATLEAVDEPATTALLVLFERFLTDEVSCRRCARAAAGRRWSMPEWLRTIDDVEVTRVVQMSDVLGDGDNVYLELTWPTGHRMVVLAYLDSHMGGAVKDAFTVSGSYDELRDDFVELIDTDEADITFTDIDPADARARLEDAIDISNHTWPPPQTDSWPACQPLLRWALSMLPPDGEAPDVVEWDEADVDAIARRFLDSDHAQGLSVAAPDLVHHILWYGTGYGHQDPYRWSPTRAELFLLDFLPRKVVAPYEQLAPAPAVLDAFVQWAHDQAGIRARRTADTLDAIEDVAADYDQLIRQADRPMGPMAILDRLADGDWGDPAGWGDAGDDDDWGEDRWDDDLSWIATRAERLRQNGTWAVGSAEALDALDDEALPDEPLDASALPDDIVDRVRRVGALTDQICDGYFDDVELRTASRRFLVDVAAGDPEIFRRRSKDETAAAAVCWVVAQANHRLPQGTTGEMLATVGVSGSVKQRAMPMVRAVDAEPGFSAWSPNLGTPRYLTSRRRTELIRWRSEADSSA